MIMVGTIRPKAASPKPTMTTFNMTTNKVNNIPFILFCIFKLGVEICPVTINKIMTTIYTYDRDVISC